MSQTPTFQTPDFAGRPSAPAVPAIQTRQPTGLPSYPLGLIAGVEKSGKTLKCVEASTSDLINNTYWIGCGEDDPDEYGAFDGARFDIVLHDGTYRGILNAIQSASGQPAGADGRPNLIVFDSGTRGWDLLKDMAQASQHERLAKRAEQNGGSVVIPDEGIKPTGDLWNTANDRWDHIVNALRAHNGPVLITARLENQVVIGSDGQPTKDRHWKIVSQKYLPYDVGFVIQMRGSYPEVDNYLTGVRSLRYKHETVKSGKDKGKAKVTPLAEDFTIDGIWRNLGIHETVSARVHAHGVPVGDNAEVEQRAALLNELMEYAGQLGISTGQIAQAWGENHNGQRIDQTSDLVGLARVRDDLLARTEAAVTDQPQGEPDPAVGIDPDEQRALAQEETRAPEPAQPGPCRAPAGCACAEHRAMRAERNVRAAEPEAEAAPAPTGQAKHLAMCRDELIYQAQVLGVPFGEYAADLINAEGVVNFAKAQKRAVEKRPEVIARLREQGVSDVAARYEGQINHPLLVIDQVIHGEGFTREAAPKRESSDN